MQLTINDLRVGNAFLQKGGQFVEFASVEDLERIQREDIIAVGVKLSIPWAIRLGFKKTKTEWMVLCINEYISYYNGDVLQVENNGSFHGIVYRAEKDIYVHDLQNLIYALTKTVMPCN